MELFALGHGNGYTEADVREGKGLDRMDQRPARANLGHKLLSCRLDSKVMAYVDGILTRLGP